MRCFVTRSTAASVTLVVATGPGCWRLRGRRQPGHGELLVEECPVRRAGGRGGLDTAGWQPGEQPGCRQPDHQLECHDAPGTERWMPVHDWPGLGGRTSGPAPTAVYRLTLPSVTGRRCSWRPRTPSARGTYLRVIGVTTTRKVTSTMRVSTSRERPSRERNRSATLSANCTHVVSVP